MSHSKYYIRDIIEDYCVIDLETTGLSFQYDDVIEIGIIKIRNDKIIDKFQTLINPGYPIPDFITEITGITNEMLVNQPCFLEIKKDILNFIDNDIIIGHNTSFDLNFIRHKFNIELKNKYMDTVQFCRKLYPELDHHRLSDMVNLLKLTRNEHRSISDCIATKELYDCIKKKMDDQAIKIDDIFKKNKNYSKHIDITNITSQEDMIDEDNFFFQKHCAFTGTLDKMTRKQAMQLVVNVGAILDNGVTKSTNYLILGNNDYCKSIKGGKSNKHKKAEKLKLSGQDIDIIDENTFYELIGV